MTSVADTLRAARALIDTPEKLRCHMWYEGAKPPYAYCGAAAVAVVATGEPRPLLPEVQHENSRPAIAVLEEVVGQRFYEWQDERTHAEVIAAFDEAIRRAEASP